MKKYADCKNILVINLMHIGDLLVTTPVLRTLRRAYPTARLSLLADLKLKDLVFYNEYIDECLLIDKKGKDDKLPAFLRYIGYVRNKKFDLVVNLHRNERASAIAAFSGAKHIVGYAKPGFSWWFETVVENNHWTQHQVLAHFEALVKTGVIDENEIDDAGLEMILPPGSASGAEKIWRSVYPCADRLNAVAAFNVGASWPTKRYLPEHFAVVADKLIDDGYHTAFFGGTMDEEFVKDCLRFMQHKTDEKDSDGNPYIAIFTGRLSLGELAASLRKCAVMVTTDSGPMHVAVAMHTPVVAMFGASPVTGFYPYDAKSVSIKTPAECYACGIHICPKKGAENFKCMRDIPPQLVYDTAVELIEKYKDKVGAMPYGDAGFDCKVIDLAKFSTYSKF